MLVDAISDYLVQSIKNDGIEITEIKTEANTYFGTISIIEIDRVITDTRIIIKIRPDIIIFSHYEYKEPTEFNRILFNLSDPGCISKLIDEVYHSYYSRIDKPQI